MNERSIFLAALDRDDPQVRQKYLEEACGADGDLRQRVEALLRSHQQADRFLATPAAEQMKPAPNGSTPPPPEMAETVGDGPVSNLAAGEFAFLAPPTKPGSFGRLDHYEVLQVVGRGGMGVVLKAFDDALQRIVAIKVMAPQLAANATARKRFVREALAAAAVSHDHVVGIHAVEKDAATPYLVMQFIQGKSLEERLEKTGPLQVKEILRIGMQIARGLAAAHAQGLVHRDIKPANILLENGIERVKITDFGLARAVDDASVTQSGVITGTPMFMAPEQAASGPIDHRADLFSLGSVLYALCTGHPPFRANTTMAVLLRVMEDTPRPIREINPDIPDWLCDIISKLHAKKPEDRFQSAKEVADLLEQHLAHLQDPHKTAMPARVEVPTAAIEPVPRERMWKQILDKTDRVGRLVQHGLFLVCAVLLLVMARIYFFDSAHRGIEIPIVFGIGFFVVAALIKQRWTTEYKGRFLRFENSPLTGEKLYLDGTLLARGGFGMLKELHATIPSGPGAGDELRVLANAGVLTFRCRIFASEGVAATATIEAEPGRRQRRRWELAWVPLVGLLVFGAFLAGKYVFSDAVRLYLLGMGELRIDDFNHDDFEQFIVFSDTSPEFVNGFSLPPHLPLFVEPGWYRIKAVGKNHARARAWEVKDSREALGIAQRLDGEECLLEIKRGKRVSVSVAEFERSAPGGPPSDKDRLKGTWRAVSASLKGRRLSDATVKALAATVTFLKDVGVNWKANPTPGSDDLSKAFNTFGTGGTFQLDPTKSPRTIDMRVIRKYGTAPDAKVEAHALLGVYRLEGDTLELCVAVDPDLREEDLPTSFDSVAGKFTVNFVLKRVADEPANEPSDKDRLQGTWVAESADFGGVPVPPDQAIKFRLEFTGGQIRFTEPDGKVEHGIFKLDPAVNPKELDIIDQNDQKGLVCIYRFDGDRLNFCFSIDKERPPGFKSRAGKREVALVLRRAPAVGPSDKDRLQGTWFAMNGENHGEPLQPDELKRLKVVFAGDRFRITMLKGEDGEGPITLDPAHDPKAIDFTFIEPIKGVVRCIYRLEGNRLTLCVADINEPRPERFESTAGSRVMVIVMRRAEPAEEGWVQLFNGKDLTGWKTHPEKPGNWRVEKGALVGGGPPSHLFSERGDFEDFHLRVEAKINPGGNSGVLFHSKFGYGFEVPTEPQGIKVPSGYEVDLASAANLAAFPTGSVIRLDPQFTIQKAKPQPPADDTWVKLEIIVRGSHVVTKVNGETATDFEMPDQAFPKGHIALQVYSPETIVQFRKIEIQELPAATSTQPGAKSDEQRLQGAWRATELAALGGVLLPLRPSNTTLMTFQGDQATFTTNDMRIRKLGKPGIVEEGTFRLDTVATPKRISLIGKADRRENLIGIYRLDGDRLEMCFICNPEKIEYPAEFKSKAGSVIHAVFQRESARPTEKPPAAQRRPDEDRLQKD